MPVPRPSTLFRLGMLLDEPALRLTLHTGGPDAPNRPVSGAHAVEIDRPARWLAPDWIMLSTGIRLEGDPAAQRALPAELAAVGVAALGFGNDRQDEGIPEPLLEAADAIGFPVFDVPVETPFREIEAFIQRALQSSEMRNLQRLASMQRYLVDGLYSFEPQQTVVHRLATLLEASVALLGGDGHVEEASGRVPDGLAAALTDPSHGVREIALDTVIVVATPIVADEDDPDGRWLVASSPAPTQPHRLTRPVLQAAAPLLAAVGRLEDTVRRQDRAVQQVLIDDLVACEGDDQSLAARASVFGVDLAGPALVIAAQGTAFPLSREDSDRTERRLTQRLASLDVPHVASTVDGRALVVLEAAGNELPDHVLEALAADGTRLGVGRIGTGTLSVAQSAADAAVAASRAEPGGWCRYDDVELPALMVGHVPASRISPQVRRTVAAIDSRPGLRDALVAYFDHDQDIAAAAASLHLHPNSLRYRLSRLADALGSSLRDPTTIATLVLTLEIDRRGPAGSPTEPEPED